MTKARINPKTKTITILAVIALLLVMLVPLASLTAKAAGEPAPLEATVTVEGNTATVSVSTNQQIQYSTLSIEFSEDLPTGISYTSVADGADIDDFNVTEPPYTSDTNGLFMIFNLDENVDVAAGKELAVYTFDIAAAAAGSHTITFVISAAADVEGYEYDWQSRTFSATIVKTGPAEEFAVTVEPTVNGTAYASKTSAVAGDPIVITATPDSGYELDTITYTPAEGTTTDITADKQLTMPAANVTVTVTFKPAVNGNALLFSVVPQGTRPGGLSDSIVNADVNSDITVNIDLTNNTDEALTINAFKVELDLSNLSGGLSFVSFAGSSDLQGNYIFATDATTNDPTCSYYSREVGDAVYGPFTLAANGGNITVATMTLHVSDEANGAKLTYGDILDIKLLKDSITQPNAGSNIHLVESIYAIKPEIENGQVEIATTYTIKLFASDEENDYQELIVGVNTLPTDHPDYVEPEKLGATFMGWNPEMTVASANAEYTAIWQANADILFIDYKYGGKVGNTQKKLILVGLGSISDSNALFYGSDAMFTTTDENYLAVLNTAYEAGPASSGKGATEYSKAYVYIVPGDTTIAQATTALSIKAGANTVIKRDGNVNGFDGVDSGDFGIVDDLLFGRNSNADIQMRLEADVVTTDGNMQFGTIDDVITIINYSNGITPNP